MTIPRSANARVQPGVGGKAEQRANVVCGNDQLAVNTLTARIGRAVWVLRYRLEEIRIAFFGWR